jgi:hypothetical protein
MSSVFMSSCMPSYINWVYFRGTFSIIPLFFGKTFLAVSLLSFGLRTGEFE